MTFPALRGINFSFSVMWIRQLFVSLIGMNA